MNLFQRSTKYFTKSKYPKNLLINGRKKLPSSAFQNQQKLYRSYDLEALVENDKIKLERIKFPDLSCNWSKFSIPSDILFRENANQTDGCYSFTVKTSRYKNIATPVHDPKDDNEFPNYAHAGVRVLKKGEDISIEPPKNRKLKSKSKKLEYSQNLLKCLFIEFQAK